MFIIDKKLVNSVKQMINDQKLPRFLFKYYSIP